MAGQSRASCGDALAHIAFALDRAQEGPGTKAASPEPGSWRCGACVGRLLSEKNAQLRGRFMDKVRQLIGVHVGGGGAVDGGRSKRGRGADAPADAVTAETAQLVVAAADA